ncbi:MAG: divalent-cation tolerance protein CutA [Syntrophobacteraceae bacterium]|jgi:periplasmic divalent cation tolerance protein|nr:divalent-cation tolerance protein CutA [Syntrophobacteraceae bacterium]
MTDVLIVLVTAGKEEESLAIARAVVEEKLAACVNIIPRIRSIYRWKGEVCDDHEFFLVMKTRSDLFPSLQSRVRELHSYEVPEIVAFPVEQGLSEYLSWVSESTS